MSVQQPDMKYVKPFMDAVRSVFGTMIQLEVTLGQPRATHDISPHEVSAIIGLSGDVAGTVVLSLPGPVAATIASKLACCECVVGSADFADALGEIVNMISGAAKAKFEGKNVSISTPSVVTGAGHVIAVPTHATCVSLPCTLACGEFSIELAIREEAAKARSAA